MTPAQMAQLHAVCFTTPRPWSADEFSELISDRTVICEFIDGGLILGRVVLDEAELLTIAVAPDARRAGLGARLTSRFHDKAFKRGARSAFLEVAEDNHAAKSLYQRSGYKNVGLRKGYYRDSTGKRIDAVVMQRCLFADQED